MRCRTSVPISNRGCKHFTGGGVRFDRLAFLVLIPVSGSPEFDSYALENDPYPPYSLPPLPILLRHGQKLTNFPGPYFKVRLCQSLICQSWNDTFCWLKTTSVESRIRFEKFVRMFAIPRDLCGIVQVIGYE